MNKREIIIRVLRGSASKKEREQLEKWLDSEQSVSQRSHSLQDDLKPTGSDLAEIRRILSVARTRRRKQMIAAIVVVLLIITIIIILFSRAPDNPGPMVFHNTKLSDVFSVLESRFGITITTNNDSITRCRFTGEFYKVQSPTDALDVIKEATNITWSKIGVDHFEVIVNECQ
jgi:ferric-dicitrate binding protein FerR (iron transport regulator)